MIHRRSPPKHRHDGTSPLPLGMDWSPPPRKWDGRDTVWPHDPRTGWSYCVTIPSWVVLPKSRDSDPVVFYRVQVGIQSPEGVTTSRRVLRRFNDFLKLFADLKRAFPKKSLPPAPPKGLLRMKSRTLLEERRFSLEEWMNKLLSDIDVSRSVILAAFLELEAAARSSFQDAEQFASEGTSNRNSTGSSPQMQPSLSLHHAAGSSSIPSDYGSDTAYETSELGTPSLGQDDNSESGIEDLTLDDDLTNPIEKLVKYGMSNIDEGLFMGQTILEQLEDFPKHKAYYKHVNNDVRKDNGNNSQASVLASNGSGLFSEAEYGNVMGLVRELSGDKIGSYGSKRVRESFNFAVPKSGSHGYIDLPGGADISDNGTIVGNTPSKGAAQVLLPLDQRNKLNRILLTLQQRLLSAKTDMEDLIARLNQEIAVKDYLKTKVTDLEVELETTKRKNKENLEQAIMIERERVTQMQWDMEELQRKSLEMELKLQSQQSEKSDVEPIEQSSAHVPDGVRHELDATKQQLEDLSKRYEELQAKSKVDIKVLVKEVKSLRKSQTELKQELSQVQMEKSEAEKLLQQEKQLTESAATARRKLLSDCRILQDRLKELNSSLSIDEGGNFTKDSTTLGDALHLLSTFNDQVEEAQLLAGFDETTAHGVEGTRGATDHSRTEDAELRKVLADIFSESARLRKQTSCVMRRLLKPDTSADNHDKNETV